MTQWSKEGFRYRLDKFPAGSAPEQVVFSIQSDQVTAISSWLLLNCFHMQVFWAHLFLLKMNKFVLFLPGLGDDLTLISLSLIIQYCP